MAGAGLMGSFARMTFSTRLGPDVRVAGESPGGRKWPVDCQQLDTACRDVGGGGRRATAITHTAPAAIKPGASVIVVLAASVLPVVRLDRRRPPEPRSGAGEPDMN